MKISKWLGWAALSLLSASPMLAAASEFPSRAVITMRGYWGFMPVGTAVQTWTLKDGLYHLENRMSGLGFSIRYVSDGTVEDGLLRPAYYAEFRGKDSLPKYESRFDWGKKTVSFGKPADPQVAAMQGPLQDLNALPFDLAWRDGNPVTYAQISNGRKLKRGPFVREADQMLDVGGRSVKVAYLVSRLPTETVELWLAPTLNYLPLRIKYRGSEKIEMQATRVEVDGRLVLGD